jgi:hypothetical protein
VVDFVARVMPERHEEYIGERQICLPPSPLSDLMPVPYFTSFESLGCLILGHLKCVTNISCPKTKKCCPKTKKWCHIFGHILEFLLIGFATS